MENIKINFPFSGKGKRARLPKGSKIIKIVGGKRTKKGKVELKRDGYAIVEYRGEVFYLIRTCLYYLLVSNKKFREIKEDKKNGRATACYLCLLYQYLWKTDLTIEAPWETVEELFDKYLEKRQEKIKCPYGYSLKPKRVKEFFTRLMALSNLKKVKTNSQSAIMYFRKFYPMPVEVRHVVKSTSPPSQGEKK